MLNKYSDNVYVINLDRRTDRLKSFDDISKLVGFEYTRYSAIDGNDIIYDDITDPRLRFNRYAKALCLTVKKLLIEALSENLDNLIICEDDVNFDMNRINQNIIIPNKYDVFYFGTTHSEPYRKISENVAQVRISFSCQCMMINKNIFEKLISVLDENLPLDLIITKYIQSNNNCYSVYPNIAHQDSGISDIEGGYLDTNFTR